MRERGKRKKNINKSSVDAYFGLLDFTDFNNRCPFTWLQFVLNSTIYCLQKFCLRSDAGSFIIE